MTGAGETVTDKATPREEGPSIGQVWRNARSYHSEFVRVVDVVSSRTVAVVPVVWASGRWKVLGRTIAAERLNGSDFELVETITTPDAYRPGERDEMIAAQESDCIKRLFKTMFHAVSASPYYSEGERRAVRHVIETIFGEGTLND